MMKLASFSLPLFFFFIHIASASNSISSSSVCPTNSCADGLQIRYPFWLSQGSPPDQYCGYQVFGLICGDSYPIFSIHGLYYFVEDIDYDNHTLHLVDNDTFNETCPRALHSVPLGSLPLSHSPLNLNLRFYYNCSSHPSGATPISCLTSGVNESFGFVEGNETGGFDWSKNCGESVMVTVMKDRVTSEGLMNEYKEALNEGFVLDWQTDQSCVECEASDGICGYSNTKKEVLCFCNDGSIQSNSCSGKHRAHLPKLIIGLIAAGVGALLMCIIIFFTRRKISLIISTDYWKTKQKDENIESFIRNNGPLPIKRYTFSEIKKMTNYFEVKLGEGGYGNVFKGNIANNYPVAVKISDFGLAKLCSKTHSIVSMLDTRGTFGYIAPEVWNRNFGGVSYKSDVYSYGMLILEMVGGKQNIESEMGDSSDMYLPHLVYKQIETGKNIAEDDDMSREESEIAKKMMIVGLWCIQPMPSDRPPMNRVIEMLEGSLDQLSIPSKPFMFPPIIPTNGEEICATNGVLSVSADYQYGR
ncbi:hypothetical protein K1719_030085 [Acacia pycnantha]|nr:hypothetical protein K1719_030085 [Acacia pycnantha]